MKCFSVAAAAALALATLPVAARQAPAPDGAHAQPVVTRVPAAKAADVNSIDAIVNALYDVISGPVGQARDWQRMRSLFVPGARLMGLGPRHDGGIGMRMLSVNDYVALAGPALVAKGFHERELARKVDRYGHFAQVFSTYSGTIAGDDKPMRGINSIQLMNDGQRWWVVSVLWEDEHSAGTPLPPRYLPSH